MKKNTVIKIIKGSVIIGGLWLTSEVWYQIGKGNMLGLMRKNNLDAVDVLNMLNELNTNDYRIKLIKCASDMVRGIES